MHNKLYSIFCLIFNFLVRRTNYKLRFVCLPDEDLGGLKVNPKWYYDFKNWGFKQSHLEMVAGADDLCELYAEGKDEVTIDLIASNQPLSSEKTQGYEEYVGESMMEGFPDKYLFGRTYNSAQGKNTFWICPVTLFVLGRYPNYLYIKSI